VPLSYWFTAPRSSSANRLLWIVSFELPGHRPVLIYVGVTMILFGVMTLAVDLLEGLPFFRSLTEGPINMAPGVVILPFSYRRGRGYGTI
jgi:hypothetical protein